MVTIQRSQPTNLSTLPKLGVGLSLQGALSSYVLEHPTTYDFLEIIPDSSWANHGIGTSPRYEDNVAAQQFFDSLLLSKPLICHSIGLSIGSADHFDVEHVAQIARWQERYQFPWHSDHLSFNRLEQPTGHVIDVGFTMPLAYDQDALDLLVERVNYIQHSISVPFLLENNVYYFEIPEQEMSEPEFLNCLTAQTGCGLLLDLHNVYANARNHGFDAWSFIAKLDLTKVVEIHIGGGMMVDDFYLDAHSGPCPHEVWQLLERTLQEAPNVAAIVFEVFGNYYPEMGADTLEKELTRAAELWQLHH